MIAARRLQRNFADGFIAEAVEDLWEPWMRHADTALEDDGLLLIIQRELAKRCKKSKTRGRKATPAEVVLRMLLLKHVRDWSYETLSREVRANLVYREFTRIGGEKVPDDRTMGNLARQMGPEVIEKLHRRVVEIAQENKVAAGRKMRVDTTVVETDVHYPTDSSLLGDGRLVAPSWATTVPRATRRAPWNRGAPAVPVGGIHNSCAAPKAPPLPPGSCRPRAPGRE